MTHEEARFLDAVCADPDNDTPRLIFADWLEERGDPRGEFIRVQLALDLLPESDPARDDLRDREAALLARHYAHWSRPFQGIVGGPEFRRGFVESVLVDARTFLRRADELFRLAPIRHVQFLDVGSNLARLMVAPHLQRLESLTIYAQHLGEDLTHALCDSPFLAELRSLNLARNRVGDRGAERLAWSPRFRHLTLLNLSDNAVGDAAARALAGSTNLERLESLILGGNELSRAGLASLCASPALTCLKHLGLARNYIGSPLELAPTGAGRVTLRSLELPENGLTAESVRMLITLPGLGGLNRLVLERNEIGNPGAMVLASWPGAGSLESLLLAANRIGDEGARGLARSRYFQGLMELDLSENPIHDPGAFEFLHTSSIPLLRQLRLPRLGLTPRTRQALAGRYSRPGMSR